MRKRIALLLSIRGKGFLDTIAIWSWLTGYFIVGILGRLFLPRSAQSSLDKRRWSKFVRYAQNKLVFYKRYGIWTDLMHIFSLNGVGDFPEEWIRFKQGEVGFQIGANRGEYTFLAAQAVGRDGVCIALEPNPAVYVELLRIAALNGFSNVICLPFACGADFYEAQFVADRGAVSMYGDGIYSMSKSVSNENQLSFTARVVPLDALVGGLGLSRVDFIIMDVEGAEVEVLIGAKKTLEKLSPRLYIEVHGTASEIESLLNSAGYEIKGFIGERNGRAHIWAEPVSVSRRVEVRISERR